MPSEYLDAINAAKASQSSDLKTLQKFYASEDEKFNDAEINSILVLPPHNDRLEILLGQLQCAVVPPVPTRVIFPRKAPLIRRQFQNGCAPMRVHSALGVRLWCVLVLVTEDHFTTGVN